MKFQRSAPPDLYSRMQTLRTCVILNGQLAILVRWHDREHGHRFELDDWIEREIDALAEEWKDA